MGPQTDRAINSNLWVNEFWTNPCARRGFKLFSQKNIVHNKNNDVVIDQPTPRFIPIELNFAKPTPPLSSPETPPKFDITFSSQKNSQSIHEFNATTPSIEKITTPSLRNELTLETITKELHREIVEDEWFRNHYDWLGSSIDQSSNNLPPYIKVDKPHTFGFRAEPGQLIDYSGTIEIVDKQTSFGEQIGIYNVKGEVTFKGKITIQSAPIAYRRHLNSFAVNCDSPYCDDKYAGGSSKITFTPGTFLQAGDEEQRASIVALLSQGNESSVVLDGTTVKAWGDVNSIGFLAMDNGTISGSNSNIYLNLRNSPYILRSKNSGTIDLNSTNQTSFTGQNVTQFFSAETGSTINIANSTIKATQPKDKPYNISLLSYADKTSHVNFTNSQIDLENIALFNLFETDEKTFTYNTTFDEKTKFFPKNDNFYIFLIGDISEGQFYSIINHIQDATRIPIDDKINKALDGKLPQKRFLIVNTVASTSEKLIYSKQDPQDINFFTRTDLLSNEITIKKGFTYQVEKPLERVFGIKVYNDKIFEEMGGITPNLTVLGPVDIDNLAPNVPKDRSTVGFYALNTNFGIDRANDGASSTVNIEYLGQHPYSYGAYIYNNLYDDRNAYQECYLNVYGDNSIGIFFKNDGEKTTDSNASEKKNKLLNSGKIKLPGNNTIGIYAIGSKSWPIQIQEQGTITVGDSITDADKHPAIGVYLKNSRLFSKKNTDYIWSPEYSENDPTISVGLNSVGVWAENSTINWDYNTLELRDHDPNSTQSFDKSAASIGLILLDSTLALYDSSDTPRELNINTQKLPADHNAIGVVYKYTLADAKPLTTPVQFTTSNERAQGKGRNIAYLPIHEANSPTVTFDFSKKPLIINKNGIGILAVDQPLNINGTFNLTDSRAIGIQGSNLTLTHSSTLKFVINGSDTIGVAITPSSKPSSTSSSLNDISFNLNGDNANAIYIDNNSIEANNIRFTSDDRTKTSVGYRLNNGAQLKLSKPNKEQTIHVFAHLLDKSILDFNYQPIKMTSENAIGVVTSDSSIKNFNFSNTNNNTVGLFIKKDGNDTSRKEEGAVFSGNNILNITGVNSAAILVENGKLNIEDSLSISAGNSATGIHIKNGTVDLKTPINVALGPGAIAFTLEGSGVLHTNDHPVTLSIPVSSDANSPLPIISDFIGVTTWSPIIFKPKESNPQDYIENAMMNSTITFNGKYSSNAAVIFALTQDSPLPKDASPNFTNKGTLTVNSDLQQDRSHVLFALNGQSKLLNEGNLVINSNSIGISLDETSASSFTNEGTITAANNSIGVSLDETSTGSFTNKGTITATNSSIGALVNHGTFVNNGTIIAGENSTRVYLSGKQVTATLNGEIQTSKYGVVLDNLDAPNLTGSIKIIATANDTVGVYSNKDTDINFSINISQKPDLQGVIGLVAPQKLHLTKEINFAGNQGIAVYLPSSDQTQTPTISANSQGHIIVQGQSSFGIYTPANTPITLNEVNLTVLDGAIGTINPIKANGTNYSVNGQNATGLYIENGDSSLEKGSITVKKGIGLFAKAGSISLKDTTLDSKQKDSVGAYITSSASLKMMSSEIIVNGGSGIVLFNEKAKDTPTSETAQHNLSVSQSSITVNGGVGINSLGENINLKDSKSNYRLGLTVNNGIGIRLENGTANIQNTNLEVTDNGRGFLAINSMITLKNDDGNNQNNKLTVTKGIGIQLEKSIANLENCKHGS